MTWQQMLTAAASELTEPQTLTHQLWRWDHNRNRKPNGQRRVTLPGLLEQLYVSVNGVASGPADVSARLVASRPPLALEALSAHAEISTQVMVWSGKLEQEWLAGGVLPNLRNLAYAGWWSLPEIGQDLTADVVRWRDMCLVLTGWEQIFRPRNVPCPAPRCGRYGTLRINLTVRAALCRSCGGTWSSVASLAAAVGHDLRCLQMAPLSPLAS